jgi:sugar lactone lactonase YvrE
MNLSKSKCLVLLFLASALGAACSDGETGAPGGAGAGDSGGGGRSDASGGGDAGGSGGGGGQGAAGGSTPEIEVIAAFDAAAFELPEGLFTRDGEAFVGFAPTGAVDAISLSGGSREAYASLPPPPPNTSFMTGLTYDGSQRLLAALVSFTSAAAPGVYRAAEGGGAATLWASHAEMVFPNGFAWDDGDDLYVTDSAFGGVFKVTPDGAAAPWVSDPALAGEPTACGGSPDDLSIGANGIAFSNGAFFVASSNKGILAKVPLEPDGSAGPVEIVAGPDCELLAGIDGIAVDDDGSVVAAVNIANRLVRIAPDGDVTTIAEGDPLDFPASLAFAGDGADRALYVTNFALFSAQAGGPAKPALLRVLLP